MERRKRNLLVVLIGIVIVVAMVSSFGLGLFAPDTAKIVLPTPEVSQQPGGEPGEQSGLVLVDVTPETVQSVIRDTLSRPDRYTRAVTIEDFWGEGESGTTHADVNPWGRVGGRRLDPDGGSPARRDGTLLHRGRRAVLAVVWRRPHGPFRSGGRALGGSGGPAHPHL